jgi:hypothetical protein
MLLAGDGTHDGEKPNRAQNLGLSPKTWGTYITDMFPKEMHSTRLWSVLVYEAGTSVTLNRIKYQIGSEDMYVLTFPKFSVSFLVRSEDHLILHQAWNPRARIIVVLSVFVPPRLLVRIKHHYRCTNHVYILNRVNIKTYDQSMQDSVYRFVC